MINNNIIKLKKYLFLISVIFLVLSLTHLIYIYLYDDSKLVPIKWWTISEWLIWNFPSLNPLMPLSWNNQYVVGLLYRSLLKYDLKENKIVWDLATCDISNLLSIECYIKDNIFWSNWKPITTEDVVSTYKIIQTTGVNKISSSLLEETQIEQKDNIIIFKNNKKDVNFLNIFFQPILPKDTINSLSKEVIFWDFPTEGQIYSWNYKITNISSDLTIWVTKIFLDKNEYNDNWNIAKLIIKLFPNTNNLLQNKESINIFNDNDNIIGDSIPRLKSNKYTLPQFVSLFINQNNVQNIDLRNFILNKINSDNLIKLLWKDNFEIVNNPYLTQTKIDNPISNKNFEKIISELGYIKKSKIVENYLSTVNKNTPVKNNTNSGETVVKEKVQEATPTVIPEDLNIDKFQKDSTYIFDPSYVEKYNFITKDDILLKWKAWKWVEAVYINDYNLSNFKSNDPEFYYRLKESFSSIKAWANNYKIYFVENWKKVLKEEINFMYYNDKTVLDSEKIKFIKELYLAEQKENKKQVVKQVEKVEPVKKAEPVEKVEVDQNELAKLTNLDERYYYNDKLESFSLNLYYVSSEKDLEDTANFIKNSLVEIWINLELHPISITDLSKILSEKDKYDMILTWVNLWYFEYNIFPYFHSSQVKNGYNFSNIKKTSLDILLEELKSDIKTPEEITKIQEKVLKILQSEQIIKTLYSPKINLLIDQNIKNISIPNKLNNKSERKDLLKSIYIKENKIINFKNKWFFDFFSFLFKKLND